MAMFNLYLFPRNIQAFLQILEKCTPDDMSALKAIVVLPESAQHSLTISFKHFVMLSVYPLQSYTMSSAEKNALLLEILRLFPAPKNATTDIETEYLLNKHQLMEVLKRIIPGASIPVGLDVLRPPTNPPPCELHMKALLGGELIIEGKTQRVAGYKQLFKESPQKRCDVIFSQLTQGKKLSDTSLAFTYQLILNLLYFETVHVKKAWEVEEAYAVLQRQASEVYDGEHSKFIRITAEIQADCNDYIEDSDENEFAFALQYPDYLKKTEFLIRKGGPHRRGLIELYKSVQQFSEASKNKRATKLLKFVRKDMAIHETNCLVSSHHDLITEYNRNLPIRRFFAAATEDYIAPCNAILLNENDWETQEAVREIAQFRVSSGINEQARANIRAVCSIYTEMAADQKIFYSTIYQKLDELISAKFSRREGVKYFKFLVPHPESGEQTLPKELPEVVLPEFDLSIKLIKELEEPRVEAVPDTLVVPIKKSQSHPTRKRNGKYLAEKQEGSQTPTKTLSSNSSQEALSPAAPLALEDQEAGETDVTTKHERNYEETPPLIESHKRPIKLPSLPQPFLYAARVLRWFNVAETPLNPKIFPEYAETSEIYQKLMLAYHAFTSSVDFFIKDLALKCIWKNTKTGNEDTRYILPAEIHFSELKKTSRGVITYCEGKDGKLYHRFFSETSSEELINRATTRTFDKMDFPSLEDLNWSTSDEQITSPLPENEEQIFKHPFLGTITIKDRKGGWVSLFPLSAEDLTNEMPDALPQKTC